MTRPLQLEGTWAPGHLLEHLELAAPQAGEGSTARTSSTALLNLGGCCRRKWTAPSSAPHCAVPRSRAASHAARKHAPHPPHPPATLRRAPWGVTPRCRAWVPVEIAVERSFLRGGRRVSFAGRRSSVVVLRHAGAACRCCALSLRVELTPRARPSVARRETTQRRGAWRAGLALGAVRNATWNWRWYIRPKVGACTSGLLVHGK